MEVILVVLQPKVNVVHHEYHPRLYNILLLDHNTESGGPTKYLPTFHLQQREEPTEEILGYLMEITGGDSLGIKGERAVPIKPTTAWQRASLSGFSLYCVTVKPKVKINRGFAEESKDLPAFFPLDHVIDSMNNNTISYPAPTPHFLNQLESWLKDKHSQPGFLDILFRNRTDFRIKLIISNPSFIPKMESPSDFADSSEGMMLTVKMANKVHMQMLAIEKCDKVVMNPLFGTSLPHKQYNPLHIADDPSSRRASTSSSISIDDRFPLHRCVREGNIEALDQLIFSQRYSLDKRDNHYMTPLHYAAQYDQPQAAQLLLDAGAYPNIKDNNGHTPLHMTALHGSERVADVLIHSLQTNLSQMDDDGNTVLQLCDKISDPAQQVIAHMVRTAVERSDNIDVHIADGSIQNLKLEHGIRTTVRQLNLQLLREFCLPDQPYFDVFTIWICSDSLELQLKEDHCPVEQLMVWKKIVSMLTDGNPATEVPQFRWRRNAKISLQEEREVNEPKAIHILFHEAYHNYIQALYPCKDMDVLKLAAILIYTSQSSYDISSAKSYLNKNLHTLVPGPMLKAKGSNWISKIMHHYKEYCPQLADEMQHYRLIQKNLFLQRKFLDLCRNLTIYGSAFFRGNLLTPQSKGGQPGIQCHIGVNDVGIHVINSYTRIMLHSFKYSEIKWTINDGGTLEVKVRDHKMDKNSPKSVKLRTRQARLIDTLMKKMKDVHSMKDRKVNVVYSQALVHS